MARRRIFAVAENLPEALALGIVLATVALLFTYTYTWVQPEYYLRWLPNAVINGTDLKAIDWFRGVDAAAFDGGPRPRIISYSLSAVNVKFRLWLYEFFIPFPNLSIAFLISLVASPFLYFFFAKTMLGTRKAAFFATCLHLTSVGFISSTSFQYHQGKVLIQPVVVLLFLLLARLHSRAEAQYFGRERSGIVAAVLALNFIGIAVDETYVVMACVGVALFYRVFWPRQWNRPELKKSALSLSCYFMPFVLFGGFLFMLPFLVKGIPELFVSYPEQNFWAHFLRESGSRLAFNLDFLSDVWKSLSLTTNSYFYPFAFAAYLKVGDLAWWPWGAGLLFALPFITISRRGGRITLSRNNDLLADRTLWGFPAAIVIYTFTSTLIQQFHTGYVFGFFYGSLVSVLLPLLLASLFLRWKGLPAFVGKLIIVGMMAITATNGFGFTVKQSGLTAKYSSDFYRGKTPGHYPLKMQKAFPGLKIVYEDPPRTIWPPYKEQKTRNVLTSYWRNWKDGRTMDFSKIGPWDGENMWFLAEMYFLQGPPFLGEDSGVAAVEGTMTFKARAKARAAVR